MSDRPLDTASDITEQTISFSKMHEPGEHVLSPEELKKVLEIVDDNTIRRYSDVRTIGLGGIGSVLSAYEPVLNREVAIKILRPAYRSKLRFLNRFIREARATAQIEHPNIVPVHQLGVFDDLGVFFTMKKVEGENLRVVLDKIDSGDAEYQRKYNLRRLLEIFISACNGVAFAHSKGIIHRDLKPSNIMLGDFGEVMVMDWGLVKYREEKDNSESGQKLNLETNMEAAGISRDTTVTMDGSISGTPAYMAPEQAGGKLEEIDEQTDLYSLGAILYSVLTLKPSPFDDKMTTNQVLSHVVNNYFVPPRKRAPKRNIPKELEAICLKAMSGQKERRYNNVRELIRDIRNYLENYPVTAYRQPPYYKFFKMCQRHPLIPSATIVALATLIGVLVAIRFEVKSRMDSLMGIAKYSIEQGDIFYSRALSTYHKKQKLLRQEYTSVTRRQAQNLDNELRRLAAEFNNHYDSAVEFLSQMEGLGQKRKEITLELAKIFKNRLELSILTQNYAETRRLIHKLRVQRRKAFYEIIESDKDFFDKVRMIVKGEGILDVTSNPMGAEIKYLPMKPNVDQVLLLKNAVRAGKSPLNIRMNEGFFLLLARSPGREEVRYPVEVKCAAKNTFDIFIPPKVPKGTVYIPAGSFYSGTDEDKSKMHRVYLPGYFISKYEVTFGEYLKFWRSIRGKHIRNRYMAKYVMNGVRREYVDVWDQLGNLKPQFKPDMPVVGITGEAAVDYCRWLGKQIGMPCRLPTSLEWEKAARGVDGRFYVWGDEYRPDVALTLDNQKAAAKYKIAAEPGRFEDDKSVYGVYDLGGNVREFTTGTRFKDKVYVVKGGSINTGSMFSKCGFSSFSTGSENDIGFRYVIPLNEKK
jgi:serine/threonine-protein kinase